MPVAVHLVEVLTLITALGILVAFTFFIVAADRILYLALLIVQVTKSPWFPLHLINVTLIPTAFIDSVHNHYVQSGTDSTVDIK